MSLSLPADPPRARSLTGVVPQMMAALDSRSDWFAPATSAIVFVLDGLGAHNLAARAGHARFLSHGGVEEGRRAHRLSQHDGIRVTSLPTGVLPGEHGIVGYRALVPERDEVLNQLRGWDTDGLPLDWQRAATLTSTRPSFAVTKSEYAGTGFTAATLAGAEFHAADDLPSVSSSPQTSPRGIRGRSCISTRPIWTPSATGGDGSPTSGWQRWRGRMPRPAPSTARWLAAPEWSSRPITAWWTFRDIGTSC